MRIKSVHIISLVLLLVMSMNFGLDNFASLELENFNLELNDSEIETEDVETKKTASDHKLDFLNEFVIKITSYFSDGYTLLEFFEKIPTPPPEA
jgi:hypothetical protein